MIGFTLSLTHQLQAADYNYLIAMRNAGFKEVLALTATEPKAEQQAAQRLSELSKWCQNLDLALLVQADAASFKQMGIDLGNVGQVQTAGFKGVALPQQTKVQTIAKLSKSLPVLIEAGKMTPAIIAALHENNANLNNLSALFPAFPVAKTGLSLSWLKQKNAWLNKQGLKSAAFLPSDEKAAPTVEQQRGVNPLAAFLILKQAGCQELFLAGQPLSGQMVTVFANYLKQKKITLHLAGSDKTLLNSEWQTDPYGRADIISLIDANELNKSFKSEVEEADQNYGSVGLMTVTALAAKKEIVINKTNAPLGPDFARIAQIAQNDLSLLPFIGPNQGLLFLPAK